MMRKLLAVAVIALAMLGNPAHAGERFDRTLELQGVRFRLTSTNHGSVNILRIVPSGRVAKRAVITNEIFGTVSGAEIADLNSDGWPEIYVYITSAGSGSYGTVIGYAVNRGKSITNITFPELMDDPVAAKGYRGHDQFSIVETTLARRFPVYREGDNNANPSGGLRQVHYRLIPGEAGWLLRLDSTKSQDTVGTQGAIR